MTTIFRLPTSGHFTRQSRRVEARGFLMSGEPAALADAGFMLIAAEGRPAPRDVARACRAAVAHARPGQTIVLAVTVPVGTTRRLLIDPLRERGLVIGGDVFVAYSPAPLGAEELRLVGPETSACAAAAAAALRWPVDLLVARSPESVELARTLESDFRLEHAMRPLVAA